MSQMFAGAAMGNLPTGKLLVTVCRSGTRAGIVARELRQKGFTIEHLESGIESW